MDILLIVGSEMGNAEMVADLVKDELEGGGHDVEMLTGGELDALDPANRSLLLVITSTTGLGEIPQNIAPLHQALSDHRPSLAHIRYGLIGMGDRNYKDSYLGGPKKWDAILSELGAARVGEPLFLDANENPMPDQDALAWLPGWLEQLGSGR